MKSLTSIVAVTTALSLVGGASVRGQAPSPAPVAPVIEAAPNALPVAPAAEADVLEQSDQPVQPTPPKPEKAQPRSGRGQNQKVRSSVALASPAAPASPFVFSGRSGGFIAHSGGAGSAKALVILSADVPPKEQANLQEDMAVMSHILNKTVDEDLDGPARPPRAMGIDVWLAPGAGSVRNLYLDGYGALFVLNVNFPLLPPPGKPEIEKEETQTDSTWDEARQELFGQPGDAAIPNAPGEAYDEEKVNKLKDTLLEALKNATNIRGLKPNDSVTVCVVGGSSAISRRTKTLTKPLPPGGDGEMMTLLQNVGDGPGPRSSVMTLRAMKSEVDAFAKGKMSPDEFRKKARVTIYAAVGGATVGGASSGIGGWYGGGAGGGFGGYGGGYGGTSRK